MPIIDRHPRVFDDLDQIAAYLQQDSPQSALRFLSSAEETIRFLADQPRIGHVWNPLHPRLKDVRSFPVKGFPKWIVFYRPLEGGIEVIRILHGARDLPAVLEEEP